MCEIQFMKRIDNKNLSEKDLKIFIKFMGLGDIGNPHAFGFFNSKKLFKDNGRFDYRKLNEEDITSDKFVVGHNRFATTPFIFDSVEEDEKEEKNNDVFLASNPFFSMSAYPGVDLYNMVNFWVRNRKLQRKEIETAKEKPRKEKSLEKVQLRKDIKNINKNIQNHPFSLGNFVMVHNGVIINNGGLRNKFNFHPDIHTDSYIILLLINKFFKESKLGNRKEKMVGAIQRTTKLINGSYSVLVYDKITKDIYYFKNSSTSFVFKIINKKLLIGTTNKKNFKYVFNLKVKNGFLHWIKKRKNFGNELFIPKSDTIYLIGNEEKEVIKKIGTFNHSLKKERNNHSLKRERKIEVEGGKNKWKQ